MAQPWGRKPYTLAQLARRAGISEGRARALYTATPSGLPRPDTADADGRPLWWEGTIDRWCASTGRAVPEDSFWLVRPEPLTSPAVELRRGWVETTGPYGRPMPLFAVVWDTEHGHLVYLVEQDGDHGWDTVAHAAAQLVEPRWWSTTAVVVQTNQRLGDRDVPLAYLYRLVGKSTARDGSAGNDGGGRGARNRDAAAAGESLFGGLRRMWNRALAGPETLSSPDDDLVEGGAAARRWARAEWVTSLDFDEFAPQLGLSLPVWLDGTLTAGTAARSLAYPGTLTVPDTSTDWPAVQARLESAENTGLPQRYPAAWAVLAADAAARLDQIRAAHAATSTGGDGWYLAARPAAPAPPLALEQRITATRPEPDLDRVRDELTRLRAVEADLDVDDPEGPVHAEAIDLLAEQLRAAARDQVRAEGRKPAARDYVPVADDGLVVYHGRWDGPVIEAWKAELTELTGADRDAALRLRRVHRLTDRHDPDVLRELYRDADGRYLLVTEYGPNTAVWAEWPVSLRVVDGWTDDTVLAADHHGGIATLLALTPDPDGRFRVDPVPLGPRSGRDAHGYGYDGGTPHVTYRALLRCALGDDVDLDRTSRRLVAQRASTDRPSDSQLWHALSTTQGPLRLPWSQLVQWAQADHDRATADRNA
ncbi:hypothetical protein ACFXGA_18720 [Actinosynnema sp. NPDC059335]|uniref:hypothetical protein n=1 Tax=Actinosynnema sp. NPDC059335 TaxID=3346804 RepID=UPI00366E58A0